MSESVQIDTSDFDAKMAKYLPMQSKELAWAVNNKLFDLARFSLKATGNADKKTIRNQLNAVSRNYPKRTLAEILVIKKNGGKSYSSEIELKSDAEKLVNKKSGHSGYCRSGWLKPLSEVAILIGKSSFRAGKLPDNNLVGQGYAEPCRNGFSSRLYGAVANTTNGGNNGETMKNKGAQEAINKVSADLDKYFDRKIQEVVEKTINK